jgi:serine/threonine-protein kinase
MSSSPGDRYQFIDRLDAGGMAEVYRAIALSLEGFEKQVAIKRVLPTLAANERFIKMFLDEARLSLYLSHTNIVSVFDVIQAESVYLIVMEYIEGANLKKVMEAARARQTPMPVPIAVYIAIQICQGLDYAHNMKDPRGRALGIVHRDISPPNVLLSWTGEVKLTDFGLAKATSQVFKTDPGVVKGKFGYLSPEAALGEEVDRRTDIFAAGILLWEMLAGRRLFHGNTDYDTLQKVRQAEIPSLRGINSSVPVELEELIKRALTRDPIDRFQTAQEMGRRLSGYLAATGSVVTAYDVAAYLEALLNEPREDRKPVPSEALTIAIQAEINRGLSLGPAPGETSDSHSGPMEDPRQWADFGFDDDEPAATSTTLYASGRAEGQSVVIPLTSVRPSKPRGVEMSGGRQGIPVNTDRNPAVEPMAPAEVDAVLPDTGMRLQSPAFDNSAAATGAASGVLDSTPDGTTAPAAEPPLKRWIGLMVFAVVVLVVTVLAVIISS